MCACFRWYHHSYDCHAALHQHWLLWCFKPRFPSISMGDLPQGNGSTHPTQASVTPKPTITVMTITPIPPTTQALGPVTSVASRDTVSVFNLGVNGAEWSHNVHVHEYDHVLVCLRECAEYECECFVRAHVLCVCVSECVCMFIYVCVSANVCVCLRIRMCTNACAFLNTLIPCVACITKGGSSPDYFLSKRSARRQWKRCWLWRQL